MATYILKHTITAVRITPTNIEEVEKLIGRSNLKQVKVCSKCRSYTEYNGNSSNPSNFKISSMQDGFLIRGLVCATGDYISKDQHGKLRCHKTKDFEQLHGKLEIKQGLKLAELVEALEITPKNYDKVCEFIGKHLTRMYYPNRKEGYRMFHPDFYPDTDKDVYCSIQSKWDWDKKEEIYLGENKKRTVLALSPDINSIEEYWEGDYCLKDAQGKISSYPRNDFNAIAHKWED